MIVNLSLITHPQGIVDLHVGMCSTALEDLGPVISSIKLHDQSCFILLEILDARMKT